MCGIAGIFAAPSTAVSRDVLLGMAGELRHRGPDGCGLYLDAGFGMVNTRLSIVDLAGGDQPIASGGGRYWTMQNGEIYNHVELRAELEGVGYRFATDCDTEVIAHAYDAWREGCLERFNGDFAIAVWDRRERELFLARDRFGVRPLFLARWGGDLVFASEIKALLRHPGALRELDPAGLMETFTLWSPTPERSPFRGVRELAPAHYLTLRAGGTAREVRWWDLDFSAASARRAADPRDLAAELHGLLEDATRIRLRADVPVGAYLSGGLDSSAIAALTRRLTSRTRRSFAVGFEDEAFDEGSFQQRMASELATDLDRIRIGARAIADSFPEVIRLAERPLHRTAPAPLLLLSRRVREAGYKVVLTGEGADEIFAGYNIFKEMKVRRFWAREPDSELRSGLLQRLYPYLRTERGRAGAFLRRFFGQGLTDVDDPLYSHRLRFGNGARMARFLDGGLLDAARAAGDPAQRLCAGLPAGFAGFDDLGKAQYLEIRTFLHGYLLAAQGDRMLMGSSVEGRFPFLDVRVAEFGARLPANRRMRGLREKHLLRRAVAPLLPDAIVERQKRPYRAPIGAVFVGAEAPDYVGDLLGPARLAEAGIFRPDAVAALLAKGRRDGGAGLGETDEMGLVSIVSTMLLHEAMVRAPDLAPSLVPGREIDHRRTPSP